MTTPQTELPDGAPVRQKKLILMRHAKSDWNDESLSDHDRPLNPRGRRDAPMMGGWLAETAQIPDRILCSTSVRTRETVAGMADVWSERPIVSYHEELYHAAPEDIIRIVQTNGARSIRLLVVAHNPGISHLVSHFADKFIEMPTAAIAVFQLADDSWSRLEAGSSLSLVQQIRPKALK